MGRGGYRPYPADASLRKAIERLQYETGRLAAVRREITDRGVTLARLERVSAGLRRAESALEAAWAAAGKFGLDPSQGVHDIKSVGAMDPGPHEGTTNDPIHPAARGPVPGD